MIAYLRRLWVAAAHSDDFFASLPEAARLGPALRAGGLSVAASTLVFAWAIARATSSEVLAPVLVFVVPGALLYAATLWFLGGLALSWTVDLDLRAWEIAGWAWVPSGFMALALLPVVAVFPVTSLVAGLLGLPVWHLAVVHAGVGRFVPHQQRRALIVYALVVLAVPIVAMAAALVTVLLV